MVRNGIFDTHCHLMSDHYPDEGVTNLLNNAFFAGVSTIMNVGYDLDTSKKAVSQVYQFQNDEQVPKLFAAVGIHPTEAKNCNEKTIKDLTTLVHTGVVVAVGEIGLDYFHNSATKEQQKIVLIAQLKIAKKFNLPVLIHVRNGKENAFNDLYEIIQNQKIEKGVLHCFTGTKEDAEKFIKLGFYISFAGNLTYHNAKLLQEVIKHIPLNKILVETDAPYLTPEPLRGKSPNSMGLTVNLPANIVFTVRKIAEFKNLQYQNIIKITNENAKKLFNLK